MTSLHVKDYLKVFDDRAFQTFADCTDNVARFRCAYGLRSQFPYHIEDSYQPKCEREAESMKLEGDRVFDRGDYKKAIKSYSAASLKACIDLDTDKSELLSRCLANRSACFVSLQNFSLALADIEAAIYFGYPENLMYKICDRKAFCLKQLERYSESLTCYEECIRHINVQDVPDVFKQKFTRKTREQINEISRIEKKAKKGVNRKFANTGHTSSREEVDSLERSYLSTGYVSDKLGFQTTEKEGTFAIAARDIEPGELILVEDPICSVLSSDKFLTNCLHCHRRTSNPLPCARCCSVVFCCPECRKRALSTHHAWECRIERLLHQKHGGIVYRLAVRVVTSRHCAEYVAGGRVCTERVAVTELEKHVHGRNRLELLFYACNAVYFVECLKHAGYFDGDPNFHGCQNMDTLCCQIGGILLDSIMACGFNSHELSELALIRENSIEDYVNQHLGSALYKTLSRFNHSCEPSIVRYFYNNTVCVHAVRKFNASEPITENYGPIFLWKSRLERQEFLQKHYLFQCECRPCRLGWDMMDDMPMASFAIKCDGCQKMHKINSTFPTPFFKCDRCASNVSLLSKLSDLSKTDNIFKKGEKLLAKCQMSEAIHQFLQVVNVLDKHENLPNVSYYVCLQKLKEAFVYFGNRYVIER